jgi:hypothetical protein
MAEGRFGHPNVRPEHTMQRLGLESREVIFPDLLQLQLDLRERKLLCRQGVPPIRIKGIF